MKIKKYLAFLFIPILFSMRGDPYFNAARYGCIGDGIVTTGSTTAGSPNVKVPGSKFLTISPVGKKFRVQGGGAANVDQILTCSSVLNDSTAIMSSNVTSSKTGTTVDYGTDNTSRIQSFFQVIVDAGGGKAFFPRGMYMIFGALQTSVNSVNPNCQIYFPLTNPSTKAMTSIEIVGEYANQLLLPVSSTDFKNIPQNATIFKSEIDGSGTLPAVFGTPYFYMTDVGANYNYTAVSMENIILQIKTQSNNTEVAGTMSGINAGYLNQFRIANAVIGVESILYNLVEPTNTTYGIIFPYFLNNAVTEADYCIFTGYHWGARISDHFYSSQFTSVFCHYALEYNNGTPGNINFVGHSATILNLQVELCPYGINVTGESSLFITSWRMERDVAAAWYTPTGNDVDFTGSGLSGTVWVQQMDMTNAGVPDYAITTNDYNRFKLKFNNNREVENYAQALTDGSTITWNLIKGKRGIVTLGGSRILSITNMAAGDRVSLEVNQDGTGNRTLTAPSGSYTSTSTFSPNPAPGTSTFMEGYYDGAAWLWTLNNVTGVASNDPASAFVASLAVAGYSPGGTEATGYETFYTSAVSHGYWSKLKDMYPFAGTSAGSQALNFVNPALFSIISHGTIVRTSGYQTSGSASSYGGTGFSPASNMTAGSAALTVWQTLGTTSSFGSIGNYTSGSPTPSFMIFFNYDGTHSGGSIQDGANYVDVVNPTYSGCFTISRTSSTALSLYRNGSSLGSNTTSSTSALPSNNAYIGARSDNANLPVNPQAQNYIFVVFSDGLTSTDVTNLYNDLNALKTAMGR